MAELHGIPCADATVFARALVLAGPKAGQMPAPAIAERGSESTVLDVESARLLDTMAMLQVFELHHKWELA